MFAYLYHKVLPLHYDSKVSNIEKCVPAIFTAQLLNYKYFL